MSGMAIVSKWKMEGVVIVVPECSQWYRVDSRKHWMHHISTRNELEHLLSSVLHGCSCSSGLAYLTLRYSNSGWVPIQEGLVELGVWALARCTEWKGGMQVCVQVCNRAGECT